MFFIQYIKYITFIDKHALVVKQKHPLTPHPSATSCLFIFLFACLMLSRFICVWLFAVLWTIACQSPLSMGLPRQECWSGLPCHAPGDFPWSKLVFLMPPALAGGFFMQLHDHILLSERSQPEKFIYCLIPTIWHFGKGKTMGMKKRSMVARGLGRRRMNRWHTGDFLGQ